MRSLTSLAPLTLTDHEFLWLSAAGWLATGVGRRQRSPQRFGIIGRARSAREELAFDTALDALGITQLRMREDTDSDSSLRMFTEVCDAVVSWDSAVTPPAQGTFITADTDVSAPIETLALGIRHVLGAHSLRGAAVSTRGCSLAVQHSLTELAEPFGLTLHVDDTHPRPDLLDKLSPPASVSLDPLEAGNAIDTSEPSLTLHVATWCALVEVLSS